MIGLEGYEQPQMISVVAHIPFGSTCPINRAAT